MLKDTALAPDFPMEVLAQRTGGLSGSDLKEVCRNAAMSPVREFVRETGGDRDLLEKGRIEVCCLFSYLSVDVQELRFTPCDSSSNVLQGYKLRPLKVEDFFLVDAPSTPVAALAEQSRIDEFNPNLELD